MNSNKVLVVGGAGYIGSHCVRMLMKSGHQPVVLDNLVFGHREAIPSDVPFYQCDLGDVDALLQLFEKESIDIVMHFAAFAFVGESVANPLKYYENNVSKTICLLKSMVAANVRKFIFSSTCATYGSPEVLPIKEDASQSPINPYGQTKLDIENILKAMAKSGEMSSAVFRYFNAAGASTDSVIGEDHDPETHLIPLAIDAATGKREALQIFGTDYPTPDGTCLRDYVHVDDLARAHIAVFEKMGREGQFQHYNLGTGQPTSVKEILEAVKEVTGHAVPCIESPRREGDPATLYADSSKAKKELGWEPAFTNIQDIIQTAWYWTRTHPDGY